MTKIPIIDIGRYAGTRIDQLPNSYLRWMIGQNFKKEWLDIAARKLSESDHSDLYLNISRHAIDMFSKRFLSLWFNSEGSSPDGVGLGTYVANKAQEAWKRGIDISKKRHKDDGIVKEYEGIKWVFNVNPRYPDYKDVITVMASTES